MSQTRTKSDAHKQKLREAAIRRYANTDARLAHSTRMAAAFQQNPALQRMHTPDAHAKRAKTMSSLWQTPDYRDKVLLARESPNVRETLRANAIRQWQDSRESMVSAITAARRGHLTETATTRMADVDWLREQNATRTLTEIADELGCSQSALSRQFAAAGLVPVQHDTDHRGGEREIQEFLSSRGVAAMETRVRHLTPPYELDIYLPDQQMAIEYHGTFWHSYNRTETAAERRRHALKWKAAQAAGIRLLQFWDTEWQHQRAICENLLTGYLGQHQTLGARACTIGVPTPDEAHVFLTAHHLQGPRPASVVRGLYHQGELMMILSLGKSRFTSGAWELLRLATKSGWHVAGGPTKLWRSALRDVPTGSVIHSYADKRLFTGAVYPRLGMVWSHDTPPGYGYWLQGKVYSRLAFQKHKIATRPGYDPTLTEAENMFQWGYRRLWDAGQSVWTYHT